MTRDPWSLHTSLSCPACHVTGRVVRFEREDGGYQCCDDEHLDDVDPYVCVECGQTWADTGVVGDVKDYRVAYGRLIEGRPYEPPKPKEAAASGRLGKLDLSAFDKMLADRWRKDIEELAARPPLDFSKLKKSAHTYALSKDTWKLPDGAQPTTMPDTRETDEKIRKLVAEMQTGATASLASLGCIPVPPSQYEALGITAPSPYRIAPPAPAGSELETVDVDEATGVITYRFVKK
jgi:hypothetical protein